MVAAVQHASVPKEHMHDPYRWIFADDTVRLAESVQAEDVGKWAKQTGDNTVWELISSDPVAWRKRGVSEDLGTAAIVDTGAGASDVPTNFRLELLDGVEDQATISAKFFTGRYSLDDGDRTDSNAASDVFTIAVNSPKWVQGPDGLLREVPAGSVAREWQDGVCQGAIVEPQRTNLLLHSQDFSNSYWSKSGDATVSLSAIPAPDGTLTAYQASGTSAGQGVVLRPSIASPGQIKSIYARTVSGVGTVGLMALGASGDKVVGLTEEWKRFDIKYDDETGVAPQNFYAVDFRAGTLTQVLIWQAQLEEGDTVSSPIPTTTAAVTRLADSITRTTGAEFNADEGTFVIEGEYIAGDTILSAGDYDVVAVGGKTKYALGYDTPITGNTITIGNGTHKTIKYLPRKLSADELAELEV